MNISLKSEMGVFENKYLYFPGEFVTLRYCTAEKRSVEQCLTFGYNGYQVEYVCYCAYEPLCNAAPGIPGITYLAVIIMTMMDNL